MVSQQEVHPAARLFAAFSSDLRYSRSMGPMADKEVPHVNAPPEAHEDAFLARWSPKHVRSAVLVSALHENARPGLGSPSKHPTCLSGVSQVQHIPLDQRIMAKPRDLGS